MLPAARRLTSGTRIRAVVRSGVRGSSGPLTVHLLANPDGSSSRAGLIVGKKVGGSVQRHRLQRQLRHLLRPRLDLMGATDVVVRVHPGAAGVTSAELGASLDRALDRAARR